MAAIAPTLGCPCDGRYRVAAFVYEAPPAGETRFDLGGQIYLRRYERCEVCRHWFGAHDIDLFGLYGSAYVDSTYGGGDGLRRRFEQVMALPAERSDNRQRVMRVLAFVAGGKTGEKADGHRRLLDIGAGIGVFAAAMREAGWRPTGIELDPRSLVHLQSHVGIEAIGRDLLTLSPADLGRFELVSLIKVLEHVENPVGLLAHAGSFVAEGGHLYIEVPDVAAQCDGPGREEFFIEHHHVFSTQSLAALIDRAGGAVVSLEALREPSGKFTLRAFASFGRPTANPSQEASR